MDSDTDELRLVLLAQCDDREAVEALFLRVQRPLLQYLRGLVGATAADDVLQDVFLTLWRSLRWLRHPELFRPWAYRIATRAAFARLKRERRWSEFLDDGAAVEDLPGPDPRLPELLRNLDPLLERISPASRAVLLLHYRHDLSIEEAAAVLGIETGTAKSRLSYGLACLRKLLKLEITK